MLDSACSFMCIAENSLMSVCCPLKQKICVLCFQWQHDLPLSNWKNAFSERLWEQMNRILVGCLFPPVAQGLLQEKRADRCKTFHNTSNPFHKFLLVMLTKQSISRELICSCVWLLLLTSTPRCVQSGKVPLAAMAIPARWELKKTWQYFELLHTLHLTQPLKCSLKPLSSWDH